MDSSRKESIQSEFFAAKLSRHLRLSTPSILSRTLNGQRPITLDLAARFADGLNLNEVEKRYFKLLVLFSNAKSMEEKELYSDLIKNTIPNQDVSFIDLDEFQIISNWHHIAILEMMELKGFKNDPKWISDQLIEDVPELEIISAIERLVRLGLVQKSPNNQLSRVAKKTLAFGDKNSNEALKKYHLQIISLAKKATTQQNYDERHLRASTFAIKSHDIDEAKNIIKLCHKKLNKLSAEPEGDVVYVASTQLFKITKGCAQ